MDDQVTALADALLSVFRNHRHVVVFCGPGALPGIWLTVCAGSPRETCVVGAHRAQGRRCLRGCIARWREHGGILIADDSAEDGLNLQAADAVCALPAAVVA